MSAYFCIGIHIYHTKTNKHLCSCKKWSSVFLSITYFWERNSPSLDKILSNLHKTIEHTEMTSRKLRSKQNLVKPNGFILNEISLCSIFGLSLAFLFYFDGNVSKVVFCTRPVWRPFCPWKASQCYAHWIERIVFLSFVFRFILFIQRFRMQQYIKEAT